MSAAENDRPRWRTALLAIALAVSGLLLLFLAPPGTQELRSRPRPAADYAEATERAVALQAADTAIVNPVCRTALLTHGARTARAVVLLHGYTACPAQFAELGQELFARGYNVLIPRYPFHGYLDRYTPRQGELTALHLTILLDEVVDIARGLGDEVVVAGLSMGGILTAWAAQNRSDITRAVVMAPLLGVAGVPPPLTVPVANVALTVPNLELWWSSQREQGVAPYSYPRFATRSIGELVRLGLDVQQDAARRPPATREAALVTGATDPNVNNAVVGDLAERWRAGGTNVVQLEFPAELGLRHDFISVENLSDDARALVYPILIALIEGEQPERIAQRALHGATMFGTLHLAGSGNDLPSTAGRPRLCCARTEIRTQWPHSQR